MLTFADIKKFDTPALLHPFLQVIRSSSTSASITSLALIAITKFLSYGIISRDSPRLPQATQLLAATLTHTRFEASNTAADEVVFLRVLKLMEGMISGPGGDLLSDESMCQIMETALRLCCEARITQLLQRSAEMSMVSMCQVVFERLKHLEIEVGDDPGALDEETKDDMDTVVIVPSVNGSEQQLTEPNANGDIKPSLSTENPAEPETVDKAAEEVNTVSVDLSSTDADEPSTKPYSLPSIKELFRTLVELLDPNDLHYTDTMRVMALRIVDVALEVAGPSIANHPSLATLAKDTLCRHLFQLVRSENMAILNESLRVAGTLVATCRPVLKLQQELFLSYLIICLYPQIDIPLEAGIDPRLYEGVPIAPSIAKPAPAAPSQPIPGSGRNTPVQHRERQKLGLEGGARKPDAREAMAENVGALVRIPSFMVDLFVNYDCDIDRNDLCADMVGLLARNAFPDSATWSTTNVPPLCLDALLGCVQTIAERLDDEPFTDGLPDVDALRRQRALKKVMIRGTAKFNENPKGGIAYLVSQGVIKNPDDPAQIASFVRATTRIDKKVLGEFLSRKSNEPILSAFMNSFEFGGQRVDEALRQLLHSFRLPGESQLIERIVMEFSEKYCANGNPEGIADKDAVYVLTYAIIMLNTDQHNKNLKSKRMAAEDFARNLRGVNGGNDFATEYLGDIFSAIKTREIILPEEHNNKDAYDHAWKELLVKVQSTSNLITCDTNIYDADMFAATWKPIIATLAYVFVSATDDAVFSRVITGFDQCAQIAARCGLSSTIDQIIYCLSTVSTLAPSSPPDTSLNTEVQASDRSVMVSETAVRFGRDDRAQLATVVMFRVLAGNESTVRDGWGYVIRIILNLFVNSLISPTFSSIKHAFEIAPIPLQPPVQVIDRDERQNEGGLFSALSSYVSSFANDEPPEPSEQEIENTLCAIDCIKACSVEATFGRMSQLPVEALRSIVDALLSHIPEDTSPRVIVVKPDGPLAPAKSKGPRSRLNVPVYDPKLVFVLELATMLALRDDETVRELGKAVADALHSVIRGSTNVHPVAISRVVYYLLSLLKASEVSAPLGHFYDDDSNARQNYEFIKVPIVLHAISSFTQDLLHQSAVPLSKGMLGCLQQSQSLRSEMSTSPDFWSILRELHSVPDAAPFVFQAVVYLTNSQQGGITADNYESAMSLLNAFATAGSVGAAEEQRHDHPSRRGKQGKQPKLKQADEVVRGTEAMTIVFEMTRRVPALIEQSHLEATGAWTAYWSPIFRVLTKQCLNPCREIRYHAFSSLQKTLLSKDLASPDHKEWTAIFGEVLFPLITQLLKPEVFQSDPIGMSETRVQAATLLCKIFLHYLVALSEWNGMLNLWIKILAIMDRLMNSGQGDNLVSDAQTSLPHTRTLTYLM